MEKFLFLPLALRKSCFSPVTPGTTLKLMCKFFVKKSALFTSAARSRLTHSALSKPPRTCFHSANPCPRAWNKRPLRITNAL